MFKIFLAIGNRDLEKFLKGNKAAIEKKINNNVKFVGETVYREGILQGVTDYRPDVIIIREGLQGHANLTEIIYNLKINFPETRIIFIAGDRQSGDALLATLVQYGIYDLIIGSKVKALDMLKRIVVPNTLSDVAHLMPKVTVDEKTNVKLFDLPDVALINESKQNIFDKETINVKEPVVKPIKPLKVQKDINNIELNLNVVEEKRAEKLEEEKKEEKKEVNEDIKKEVDDNLKSNAELNKKENSNIPNKKETVKKIKKIKSVKAINLKENKSMTQSINSINEEKVKQNLEIDEAGDTNKKINKESNTLKEPQKNTKLEENNSGLFNKLFNKQLIERRVTQQIVTFVGGKGGVGNSQVAFNTALKLAQDGYKTIYIDLNSTHSSIDCIYQLGYTDVGIDTALKGLKTEDYLLVERSIVNMEKILTGTIKENYLYKTYSKMPKNIDFMFFSQRYIEREDLTETVDFTTLKDLDMYLLMQQGYDYIIIDAPYNILNKLTETSLIYSNKIFFTITQDYSVIGNHLNQIKLMDKKRIKFREKFYYLVNKYENADLSLNDVYKLLSEAIRLEELDIISIPNINKEFINANYLGTPIIWYSKNKDIVKSFSEIEKLIIR